jgi:[acyl-carrier-protein] S-malonyltransferase
MLAELAAVHRSTRQPSKKLRKVRVSICGTSASQGPEEQLNRTENTQPALLAASVAVWRVWQKLGGAQPAQLSGHSLGEYSALVCALVRCRCMTQPRLWPSAVA